MTNLQTRAISGTVYVALIVGSILFGPQLFTFLMACFGLLAAVEYTRMVRSETGASGLELTTDIVGVCFITLIPFIISFTLGIDIVSDFMGLSALLASAGLLYYVARCIVALYVHTERPLRSLAYSVLGVTYISLGIISVQLLDIMNQWTVLAVFIFIWVNDTGAYLVGSAIGRHKMTPRLSPKKSWEGFFGGMICCIIVGVLMSLVVDVYQHMDLILGGVIFPFSISVLATLGDLLESLIKRSVGVKDAGNIIPGHGGVLDRIDSLLFVTPGLWLLLLLFNLLVSF